MINKRVMDIYTITSLGQNAADFVSSFTTSIKLSDNYEVALLKITHPPTNNVTADNNMLAIKKKISRYDEISKSVRIPVGYYKSSHDVLIALNAALRDISDEKDFNLSTSLRYKSSDPSNRILTIQFDEEHCAFASDGKNSLFSMFNIKLTTHRARSIVVEYYEYENSERVGFVYSSIVVNSLIDDNKSRLLDVIPIRTNGNNENYYDSKNVVFHDMATSSFIDIWFQIRDINGQLISFMNNYPTVVCLGVRSKS